MKSIVKHSLGIVLFLLTVGLGRTAAQDYEWAYNFGSTNFDLMDDIATDAAGNVYASGTFYNTMDVDPSANTLNFTAVDGYDAFLLKFSPAGSLLWARHFGGTDAESISQIRIASDGSVYMSGLFRGTTDFDPGPATFNLSSNGNNDGFLVKLDVNGDFVWANAIGGSTMSDFASDFDLDANDNPVVVGSFQGTVDLNPGPASASFTSLGANDIFVAKYNSAGQYLWSKRVGGANNDAGQRFSIDPFGNLLVCGFFQGTVDFDPGTGTSNLTATGNNDIYVLKLDSVGDYVWAKNFGSSGASPDYMNGITTGLNGEVYVTGSFQGSGDFDPGTGTQTLTAVGSNDVFVVKLDAAGNHDWSYSAGGNVEDEGFGLAVDGAGDVYVCGYVAGMVDMDPGAGTTMVNGGGTGDLFIQKLDQAGNLIWVASSFGANSTLASQIVLGNNGDLYIVGWFTGTVDMDPSANTANLSSNGSIDGLLARYSQATFCLPSSSTINPTACNSYSAPSGQVFTSTGTYTDTIPNAGGCDSIITINLEVNQSSTASIVSSQCGGTYTAPSGQVFTSTGIYSDTIPNAVGCDSVISIDLTINLATSSSISPTLCNSDYTSPSGMLLTMSGTYTDTIPNAAGCDSIITINLTIDRVTASFTQSGSSLIAPAFIGDYQWFDCDNGPIAGATSSTFTPSQTGNYAVIMTENGCSDTSACQNVIVVGMEDGMTVSATVWPNPTQGGVHLRFTGLIGDVLTVVYNAQGQEILKNNVDAQSVVDLDLPGAAGIYFLQLRQGTWRKTIRLVKK